MFHPKQPSNPTPPATVTPTPVSYLPDQGCNCSQHHAPAPSGPVQMANSLTPRSLATLLAGGTALVLIVGTILVSLLLAVAVTAVSVALCAVILRPHLPNRRTTTKRH